MKEAGLNMKGSKCSSFQKKKKHFLRHTVLNNGVKNLQTVMMAHRFLIHAVTKKPPVLHDLWWSPKLLANRLPNETSQTKTLQRQGTT